MAETLQDLERLVAPIQGKTAKCGHVDPLGHLFGEKCGKCIRRDERKYSR